MDQTEQARAVPRGEFMLHDFEPFQHWLSATSFGHTHEHHDKASSYTNRRQAPMFAQGQLL
jgi:hypothetical protein